MCDKVDEIVYDVDKFENILKEHLAKIPKEKLDGKSDWTSAVKKCLLEIADEYGLSSSCHLSLPIHKKYKKHDNHEWLCDVMLYIATPEKIEEVILCAESEWNTDVDEVFFDFSKLLVIKSRYHLMIHNMSKKSGSLEEMENYIDNSKVCKKEEETYFFVSYAKDKFDFKRHRTKTNAND